MAQITNLPVEIIVKILKNLDRESSQNCAQVCKQWLRIVRFEVIPLKYLFLTTEKIQVFQKQTFWYKIFKKKCSQEDAILKIIEPWPRLKILELETTPSKSLNPFPSIEKIIWKLERVKKEFLFCRLKTTKVFTLRRMEGDFSGIYSMKIENVDQRPHYCDAFAREALQFIFEEQEKHLHCIVIKQKLTVQESEGYDSGSNDESIHYSASEKDDIFEESELVMIQKLTKIELETSCFDIEMFVSWKKPENGATLTLKNLHDLNYANRLDEVRRLLKDSRVIRHVKIIGACTFPNHIFIRKIKYFCPDANYVQIIAGKCSLQNSTKLMLKALNEFHNLQKIRIERIKQFPEIAFQKFVAKSEGKLLKSLKDRENVRQNIFGGANSLLESFAEDIEKYLKRNIEIDVRTDKSFHHGGGSLFKPRWKKAVTFEKGAVDIRAFCEKNHKDLSKGSLHYHLHIRYCL